VHMTGLASRAMRHGMIQETARGSSQLLGASRLILGCSWFSMKMIP
jgi:hypothetical protein